MLASFESSRRDEFHWCGSVRGINATSNIGRPSGTDKMSYASMTPMHLVSRCTRKRRVRTPPEAPRIVPSHDVTTRLPSMRVTPLVWVRVEEMSNNKPGKIEIRMLLR